MAGFIDAHYGLIIILITILTRVFIVSIAWSYGVFLVALKKAFPEANFAELGWISGLAQGIGSLVSPSFLLLSKFLGTRATFSLGIALCFISLLLSSYAPSTHWLFVTYSIPFGLGSGILFVLGSVVTGLYYPPSSPHHVSSSVAVSLGFPLGFLILNLLTEHIMIEYDNDWQLAQRIYSLFAFLSLIILGPFFTDTKKSPEAERAKAVCDEQGTITFKDTMFLMTSEQFGKMIRVLWWLGLMANSCANTAIITHMNGYFETIGLDTQSLNLTFVTLGLADALFRVILAVTGRHIKQNLLLFYIGQAFIGLILSSLWTQETNPLFNTVYCFLFGMCPAVVMSLMYTVNSEISGEANLEFNYTINVMISGIGIILGPILSGLLLDESKINYSVVFNLASKCYLLSIVLFFSIKIMLIKYADEKPEQSSSGGHMPSRRDYVEFKDDS